MEDFNKSLLRPVWVEIDLDALDHNFKETRRLVGGDVKIICCLKANAYGIGAPEVAEEVISMGAYGIAVADLFEAIMLRKRGIKVPVLIYANNLPSAVDTIIAYNLIPTITDLESARLYSSQTKSPLDVYVKIDVGLNRVGVLPEEAVSFVQKLTDFDNINVAGIYTHPHFSEDDAYVNWQLSKLRDVIGELQANGIDIPIKMAASTRFIVQFPNSYLNAVDPGRLILGNPQVKQPRQQILLKPVIRSLKTRIIAKKRIKPRREFEKQAPFQVPKEMIVGIIPIGWGDGYSQKHSSIGPVLVSGKRVSILDGIALEHTRIDLTDIPEAKVGDEVVLIGKQGDEEISLDEIIAIRGTNLHEIGQSLRNEIPRLYIKNGRPYKLKTPLEEIILKTC